MKTPATRKKKPGPEFEAHYRSGCCSRLVQTARDEKGLALIATQE